MLSCNIWFCAPSLWMGRGLESRCVGRVYGADGAVRRTAPSAPYTRPTQRLSSPRPIHKLGAENHMCDARHHPHRTHDLRSGSQVHDPSTNSVQKTICCNSTSNAPDDGRMRPKHVELRIHQQNYLVTSSWNFTLF